MIWRTILIVFSLLAACSAPGETLKIATLAPDGTTWMNAMREGAQEVAQRTDGRVEFRFFPGGVMGNDRSVLRKIRFGQLQGGALTGGGLALIDPDTQVYGLPFTFRSYAEVDYVRERMDEVLLGQLEEKGFVAFGLTEGGFAYLMSERPVGDVAALRRRKVWVPEGDPISRAAFEAVGVSPVSLPLIDVLTALQTGLIDTVATSPIGAIALQWHTQVSYLTDAPLLYVHGTLVVQRKAFEKLSKPDQAVVREVMGRVLATLNAQNRRDNASAREALQGAGIEVVHPDRAELRKWQGEVAEAMARLAEQGVFSRARWEELKGHLSDYRERGGPGE